MAVKSASKKHLLKNGATETKKISYKRVLAIYASLVIVSAIIATIISVGDHHTPVSDPFSPTQRAAAGFQLYYPMRLPRGYRTDSASVDNQLQSKIVNFRILDANGGSIDITEQKTPTGFNFITFYNTFENRTTFKSHLGTVTSGLIDSGRSYLTSLVTPDQTWIFLHTSTNVPQSELKLLFSNFTASK